MTDLEYIQGFKKNDERVISAFYAAQRQSFFAFFRTHYSKTEEEIIDIFQDACIALWRNIYRGKLTPEGLRSTLSTYFISIGKYTMMAKDRKFNRVLDEDEVKEMMGLNDDPEELERQYAFDDFLFRIVQEMKPPCNSLLKAQYWDKLSGVEIAEKFGFKNADSVKAQKFKCIKKLKPLIEKFMKL